MNQPTRHKLIPFNLGSQRFWLGLLVLQVIVLAVYLWQVGLLNYRPGGDTPSFVNFPFSSLTEALSSHRTVGLPLIIKGYNLFFDGFTMWPWFELVFYALSVFLLYWAMVHVKFVALVSFAVATGLLWNPTVHKYLRFPETETFATAFIVLSVAALLLAVRLNSKWACVALGLCVFAVYQIRPSVAFLALIVPFWGFAIALLISGDSWRRATRVLLRLAAICLVPLLLFSLLRLAVVGDFGIVSFSGVTFSGYATTYLDQDNVGLVGDDSKELAAEILERKKRLPPPCGPTTPPVHADQFSCFNPYLMTSWLAAIDMQLGIQPFDDPAKNIEPWLHVDSLSGFFSNNNVDLDASLKKYAVGIMSHEKRQYLGRMVDELVNAVNLYLKTLPLSLKYLGLLVLAPISFAVTKVIIEKKGAGVIDRMQLGQQNREIWALTIIGLSIPVFGSLIGVIIGQLYWRFLSLFAVFLLSILAMWALPPPFTRADAE